MDTIVDRVAGIDISRADVKVCVRIPASRQGSYTHEVRTFATTTPALLEAAAWLRRQQVSLVVMESTGQYWKPVYFLLEAELCPQASQPPLAPREGEPPDQEPGVRVWLVNPHHLKKVPGRKSDVSDAQWIAQIAAFGLIHPSFVPPEPIRQLREVTRTRSTIVGDRTRVVQQLHDVLEEAGVKLGIVASDILGVSGRLMLNALVNGELDPVALAALARGRLITKSEELAEAMTTMAGRFGAHQRFMVALHLRRVDELDAQLNDVTTHIEQIMNAFRRAEAHLMTIPGVGTRAAQGILGEIGVDMSRFPTAGHLTSWAGVCPGTNESGGRRLSGHTRPGNAHLKGHLGQIAMNAVRVKGSYLHARYQRLRTRMSRDKALVAIANTILRSIWYMLTRDQDWHDLGTDYYQRHHSDPTRRARHLTDQLQALGFKVTITPTT